MTRLPLIAMSRLVAFLLLTLSACDPDAPNPLIGIPDEDTDQDRQARIDALGLGLASLRSPGCLKQHAALLYHDCQAVVNPNGASYGPLILSAIDPDLFFVDDSTFSALEQNEVIRVGSLTNKGTEAFEFAPRFLIQPASTHCLYLGRPRGSGAAWRAMFVDCSDDPTHLPARRIAWQPSWSFLHVERTPSAGDIPNTATLDWDDRPGQGRQVMGIRCGSAWCLISGWGPPSLRPIPNASAAPNRAVRGWHDQQVLAVPTVGGSLRPGTATATLMAEPDLESIGEGAFATPQLVARAHFTVTDTVYQRKLNLDAAGATAENEIRIVREGADWFALIRSASGSEARFAVVRRSDLGNIDPPGSARWGWLEDDENVWVRCGGACCEITPGRLEEL